MQGQNSIGTAWHGTHVVTITCHSFSNQLQSIHKSSQAPIEPSHPSCTETLSRYLSIGYKIVSVVPISGQVLHYVLVKN